MTKNQWKEFRALIDVALCKADNNRIVDASIETSAMTDTVYNYQVGCEEIIVTGHYVTIKFCVMK